MLIEKGSDLNARRSDGYSALHVAAANGNNTGVRLLLEHGADPLIKDNNGRTPLLVALSKGHRYIAELLEAKMAPKKK